ncbi:MAG: acyl-ACP--UDP-N-acetylglucosamine O-acyltransferase [Phycisphaerae bacterium]|nr:acyl-ACP--UDP-N-acetylglucosamine O-acyltransferase [Phycisphaerae bacterium]
MPIHPTAIVDKTAEIDASADVGPYVIIEGPVHIAADVRVYPHAYLCGWTRIAENCEVHMGAVLGHVPQDVAFTGERSYCEIGPNTVIREYATVHRGTIPESKTVVGANCLLGVGSHVAHNCVIGDHVNMLNGVLLAGHVHVGARAFLSGGAGVHQFARIGELVMLSGNAAISCDIPPFLLAYGRDQIGGINRVGLTRAGFSRDEIEEIRQAHKLLYRSGRPLSHSIAELAEKVVTPAGHRMVDFLKAERKRSLVRPRRALNQM